MFISWYVLEYLSKRSRQNDRNTIIKSVGKEYAVAVWNRTDYMKEADKQRQRTEYLMRKL